MNLRDPDILRFIMISSEELEAEMNSKQLNLRLPAKIEIRRAFEAAHCSRGALSLQCSSRQPRWNHVGVVASAGIVVF